MNESDWTEADEISDRIIELLNQRLNLHVDIDQILVGVCLGLLGFLKTAPSQERFPDWLVLLQQSAAHAIDHLVELGPKKQKQTRQ